MNLLFVNLDILPVELNSVLEFEQWDRIEAVCLQQRTQSPRQAAKEDMIEDCATIHHF